MAGIVLKDIWKIYPGDVIAVQEFNLTIQDKEFVVLVGPSGCGKSTTLRMIAGLEEITQGELYIGDKLVNDVPPKNRDIAMVFQNYALYPHMTVFKNMAFGLELRKTPKDEIKRRVGEAARAVAGPGHELFRLGAVTGRALGSGSVHAGDFLKVVAALVAAVFIDGHVGHLVARQPFVARAGQEFYKHGSAF